MIRLTLVVLVFSSLLAAQYPYPGRRIPPSGQGPQDTRGVNTQAVASFEGVFKAVDKKFVTIEVEEGQIMRMYVTGSTKFMKDDARVKATDFHNGDRVVVEAERDARMNLLAVRVLAAPERRKSE